MNDSDRIRLQHMLEAAREALAFVEGVERDELARDRKLALSLVKEFEIIGEAAARISPEVKQSLPSIPWPKIIGMRNRLIHAYAEIDFGVLWDTVTLALSPLIADLESALEGE
jgi:uncharacterized protein with HEPN domain